MEGKNNTGMIVGVIAVIVLVVGGIWLAMSGDDDSGEDNTTAQTTQTQQQEAPAAEVPSSNIVELAQATDSLSTLVTAVVEAELVDTLSSEGPFTVFAPTNDAFDALPEGTLESLLLPENVGQLTDILTFHVVAAEAFSSDLSDGQKITTVQGDELTVSIEGGVVKINDATVVSADIEASNGVVHVIDSVLLP
ncbi:MAG: fasciclin domain-containing protein [Candidatus Saccharimonadales bacterium]|nr:fasciclin domain-containing protein [Candidatus Saccharimonadales bacterium]